MSIVITLHGSDKLLQKISEEFEGKYDIVYGLDSMIIVSNRFKYESIAATINKIIPLYVNYQTKIDITCV